MGSLRILSSEEFPAFFETAVASYAHDNAASGRWLAADAAALARKEMLALLPAGAETPGHHLYAIQPEGEAAAVGYLWLATLERGTQKVTYVYQVIVSPEHRRRGYARVALQEAERIAAGQGHASIALHVFANNETARSLYESLGYGVTSLNLSKALTGA